MAYTIKKKKVNRKWMFKVIQEQQKVINDILEQAYKMKEYVTELERIVNLYEPKLKTLPNTGMIIQPVNNPGVIAEIQGLGGKG